MFRGDLFSNMDSVEPVVTSPTHKTVLVCRCGATKFKWLATVGTIKSGGFVPESYEYECVGCGHVITDEDRKNYFK